jgi:hypothetical protein
LNNASVGDPIFDIQNREIGNLTHWIALNPTEINFIDAALFQYTDPSPVGWRLLSSALSKPRGFIMPKHAGHVYMMQENGVPRKGWISSVATASPIEFNLGGSKFSFSNLIEITPFDGMQFSQPGNSGSIILSNDQHFIVGLLIGKQTSGVKSFAIPFVNGILDYLPLIIK